MLCRRLGDALMSARISVGLSVREVARRTGVSADTIRRVERGDAAAFSIDTLTHLGEVLGLELAASFYPAGDPVRDRAHLALLGRLRRRLGAGVRWRTEVAMPIAGDLRSGDAVLGLERGGDALVEAETHLGDLQLIERRSAAKQRDLGAARLILLVSETRHNRAVIRLHPELKERFPVDTRACLRHLARGEDPGGDALVIL
jgi:transcriptional regulator with XRE-family HTH domain